jgi:hypothetical protein
VLKLLETVPDAARGLQPGRPQAGAKYEENVGRVQDAVAIILGF